MISPSRCRCHCRQAGRHPRAATALPCCLCPRHRCCRWCLYHHPGGARQQHGGGGRCRGHTCRSCAADALPAAAASSGSLSAVLPLAAALPTAVLPPITPRCRCAAAVKLPSWPPLPLPPRYCCCRAIAATVTLLPPCRRCRRAAAAIAAPCCCPSAATAALLPCCRRRCCCHRQHTAATIEQ